MLLTELATTCPFSSPSVRQEISGCEGTGLSPWLTPRSTPRKASHVLQELFTHPAISPAGSAVLVQIILKDLRPLLYPVPQDAMHYTAALTAYKSNAFAELTIEQALRVWDTSGALGRHWKMQGWAAFSPAASTATIGPGAVPDECPDVEDPEARADTSPLYSTRPVTPIIGQPVGVRVSSSCASTNTSTNPLHPPRYRNVSKAPHAPKQCVPSPVMHRTRLVPFGPRRNTMASVRKYMSSLSLVPRQARRAVGGRSPFTAKADVTQHGTAPACIGELPTFVSPSSTAAFKRMLLSTVLTEVDGL